MTKIIDKLSFLLTPNGYKAGVLYPFKPLDNRPAFAWLSGIVGANFSTPNVLVNQIRNDINFIAYVNYINNGATQTIVSKSDVSPLATFDLGINASNNLFMQYNIGGYRSTTSNVGIGNTFIGWVRLTRNSITGEFMFYISQDSLSTNPSNISWTQLGTSVLGTSGTTTLYTRPVIIGSSFTVESQRFKGVINRVILCNSLGYTPVVDFNPNEYRSAQSATTWVSSTGETWTINGSPNAYIKEGLLSLPFTRNSVATRTNQAGLVESVAANVPRIHYPNQGRCPVILMEPQRTNLCLRSQEFDNASWSKVNSTISANEATAPDGTLTADLSYPSSSGLIRGCEQPITVVAATRYTNSIFVKANSWTWIYVGGINGSNGAWFNLSTGATGTVQAGVSASITAEANGWFRITVTGTSTGTTGYNWFRTTDANNTLNCTASGTNGVYVWGAQTELGAYATSYIPTTNTTATRLADTITNIVSDYGALDIASQGTIHFEGTFVFAPDSASWSFLYHNTNQNSVNGIRLAQESSGLVYFRDSLNTVNVTPNLPIGVPVKVTFVIDGRLIKTYLDGILYSTRIVTTPVSIIQLTQLIGFTLTHITKLAISGEILNDDEIATLCRDFNATTLPPYYAQRVQSDGGTVEAQSCLTSILQNLQNIDLN